MEHSAQEKMYNTISMSSYLKLVLNILNTSSNNSHIDLIVFSIINKYHIITPAASVAPIK